MAKVLNVIIDLDYNTMTTEETFKKELKTHFADFEFSDEFTEWLNENYNSSEVFFLTKKEKEELENEFIDYYLDLIRNDESDRFHIYKDITVNLED